MSRPVSGEFRSRLPSANSFNYDEENCRNVLRKSIEFLIQLNRVTEPASALETLNADEVIDKVAEMCEIAINAFHVDKANLSVFVDRHELIDVFCRMLDVSYLPIKTLVTKYDGNVRRQSRVVTTLSPVSKLSRDTLMKIYLHINRLVNLIWYLTNFLTVFRVKFHEKSGTQRLLQYIYDHDFLRNCLTFTIDDSESDDQIIAFINSVLGSLHNLSKTIHIDEFQSTTVNKMTATQVLVSFANFMTDKRANSTCTIEAYMTLANVLTDKEIDELPNMILIVKSLIKFIAQAAKSICSSDSPKRLEIELESGKTESVCMVYDEEGTEFDIIELISSLYHIAVNDKIKCIIYFECNIKLYLEKIIEYGNLIEKEYCLKLLYQLTFDGSIVESIKKEEKLLKLIKELNKLEKYNSNLIKYCDGILFIAENKLRQTSCTSPKSRSSGGGFSSQAPIPTARSLPCPPKEKQVADSGAENASKQKQQIMISYNSYSRDLCLRIKAELEKLGFKVWIDVENIHGSSLESMARAIETSDCILICMTERYKMSPNCRAEAEYTFNIGKPYIPLKMQLNYKPDGWLGLVLGSKIFIDFMKYPFEESFFKLKHELKEYVRIEPNESSGRDKEPSKNPGSEKPVEQTVKPTVNLDEWTNEQVQKWLIENKISHSIGSQLCSFDGPMLKELALIQQTSPDTFYGMFTKLSTQQPSIHHLVHFSKTLRKFNSPKSN